MKTEFGPISALRPPDAPMPLSEYAQAALAAYRAGTWTGPADPCLPMIYYVETGVDEEYAPILGYRCQGHLQDGDKVLEELPQGQEFEADTCDVCKALASDPGRIPATKEAQKAALQLQEDAALGDRQAGAELARREELGDPAPFFCSCGARIPTAEMHAHLEAHCRAIEQTGGLSRLSRRRSTATLADLEGEPEAAMLERPAPPIPPAGSRVGFSHCVRPHLPRKGRGEKDET